MHRRHDLHGSASALGRLASLLLALPSASLPQPSMPFPHSPVPHRRPGHEELSSSSPHSHRRARGFSAAVGASVVDPVAAAVSDHPPPAVSVVLAAGFPSAGDGRRRSGRRRGRPLSTLISPPPLQGRGLQYSAPAVGVGRDWSSMAVGVPLPAAGSVVSLMAAGSMRFVVGVRTEYWSFGSCSRTGWIYHCRSVASLVPSVIASSGRVPSGHSLPCMV